MDPTREARNDALSADDLLLVECVWEMFTDPDPAEAPIGHTMIPGMTHARGTMGNVGQAMARPQSSNPRDRDRFITQMMEDERYHWQKQHDPDFVGSATSGGSSTKTKDHEGSDGDEEADEFDAKLEKIRKHRAIMK